MSDMSTEDQFNEDFYGDEAAVGDEPDLASIIAAVQGEEPIVTTERTFLSAFGALTLHFIYLDDEEISIQVNDGQNTVVLWDASQPEAEWYREKLAAAFHTEGETTDE